jgi:signal peptidase
VQQPTADIAHDAHDAHGSLDVGVPAPAGVGALRRIAGIATWVLVGVSVLGLLVFGIGPQTGAYRTLTVLSGSMTPTFRPGDVVIATSKPPKDVRVGDVIVFTSPDSHATTTHRVIKIIHGGVLPEVQTKGDANNAPDPFQLQLQGNELWYMRASVPKVGYVIHALRTPWMMVLAMGCLLFLALAWVWGIWSSGAAPLGAEDDDDYLYGDDDDEQWGYDDDELWDDAGTHDWDEAWSTAPQEAATGT